MAKAPAFQFYPQDWLVGTATLTPAQKGGYIDLLAYEWEHGAIAKDMIEKFSGLTGKDLEVVLRKFSLIDNFYTNRRLEETRARQKEFSRLQSERGKKGGRPQKEKPDESQEPLSKNKPPLGEASKEGEDKDVVKEENYLEKSEKPLEDSDDEKLKQYDDWGKLILEKKDHDFDQMLYAKKINPSEITNTRIEFFIGLLNTYPAKRPPSQQAFRRALLASVMEQMQKTNGTTSKFQPPPTDTVYKPQTSKPQTSNESLSDIALEEKKRRAREELKKEIEADVVLFSENENCRLKIPAVKMEILLEEEIVEIIDEEKRNYFNQAREDRMKELNANYDPATKIILHHYRDGKTPDSELGLLRTMAREIAYRIYLKNRVENNSEKLYSTQPAPENLV